MQINIPTTVKNKELVEKRRKQIVLAAIKLFAANGFHKSTMRDLAEETGISHANIYDYIGTKEDIFFLIHDLLAGSAMEILNRYIESASDPAAKLRKMVQGEFAIMDQWSDGLLLIYQESHILSRPLLKELLKKERYHLEKFEIVIRECVEKGLFKECNVRLIANLIKSMIDSWALKRWDYRGHVNQMEAEKMILELIFDGLLRKKPNSTEDTSKMPYCGRIACVANAATVIGRAVCNALIGQGFKVIIHGEPIDVRRDYPILNLEDGDQTIYYNSNEVGPVSSNLLRKLEDEVGPIEIFIQDLGISTTQMSENENEEKNAARLNEHFIASQAAAGYMKNHMSKRGFGRILFITPWAWDAYLLPMHCKTIISGVQALTKSVAKSLAKYDITANCIVPGFIKTIRPSKIQKDKSEEILDQLPIQRLGDIEDIINTVLFLIGDSSRYITGQSIEVNGGVNL